jgi:hypothetical protein
LTELQPDLLDAFFAREQGFYLTGGAALAGFHLAHRASDDLDLFTLDDDAFERGERALMDAAAYLGCRIRVAAAGTGRLARRGRAAGGAAQGRWGDGRHDCLGDL